MKLLIGIKSVTSLLLCLALAAPAADQGRDEFLYARKLFEEGYYDLAAEQLDRCLRDFPGMTDAAEAQYLLGESHLRAGDPEKARAALLKAAIVYPQSPWAPEALFEVGVALEAMGRAGEAAQSYERVQGFYSGHRLAPEGLHRAAALYISAGDTTRAESVISLLIEKYPESEAADAGRLTRAAILASVGNHDAAEQYYEWVATRTTSDSLAAESWLQLGRYRRANWAFDRAAEALRKGIERAASSRQADAIRLELADLLTWQGSPDEALKTVSPLLTAKDRETLLAAKMEAGDAYYRRGEYQRALENYHAASDLPIGALKAAWTAEMLVSPETALERYKKLAPRDIPEAAAARLRAAILAAQQRRWDESARLWEAVVTRDGAADSSGRIGYEYLRARQRAGMSIAAAVDSLKKRAAGGMWSDEIAYLAYLEAVKATGAQPNALPPLPEEFFSNYPASPYLDSALAVYDFQLRQRHRSERLMERMAELSSRPLGKVTPVQWAMDWGDFYLDDFKDPVKSIDQFDRVRDDTTASAGAHLYALQRGTQAYLMLYEAALWERDRVGSTMYGDSVRSRLTQLKKANLDANAWTLLAAESFRLDIKTANGDSARSAAALKRGRELIRSPSAGVIPTDAILAYLYKAVNLDFLDSAAVRELIGIEEGAIPRTRSERLLSGLKYLEVPALAKMGRTSAAVDTARIVANNHPLTVCGAAAKLWLAENPALPAAERMVMLDDYCRNYPYLGDTVELDLLAAELLDSIGKPLESLAAWERAKAAADWGKPPLDILDIPDDAARLRRGTALLRAGRYEPAEQEIQALLNFNPGGKSAPAAFLALAQIKQGEGEPADAAASLDSLERRFPFAPETAEGLHLKSRLLMDAANYRAAQLAWRRLAGGNETPDSIAFYLAQDVVCFHRLNDQDGAKTAAAEYIKRFKDRTDLDQYKALFLLEKGRAYDRAHQYDDAQKQYRAVREDYRMTQWADDAAYSAALSLVSQGKTADGAKALQKFVDDYPDSKLKWDALLSLGLEAYRAERYPEAASALKQIWDSPEAQRSWKPAFEALVAVYKDSRFWDAALRLTREYLTRFPDTPDDIDRRMDIGWLYLQIGDWDEGIRQYRSLLPLADPEREAEVQYYIGEAFMAKSDFRTAILEFMKVKILGRKTKLDWGVTALYQSGQCYEKLDEKDNAARMYQKIISETGATSNYGRTAQQRLDAMKVSE